MAELRFFAGKKRIFFSNQNQSFVDCARWTASFLWSLIWNKLFFNLDFIRVIILMTPVEIHFMIPDIFMVFSQCIKEIDAFILSFLPIQSQGFRPWLQWRSTSGSEFFNSWKQNPKSGNKNEYNSTVLNNGLDFVSRNTPIRTKTF